MVLRFQLQLIQLQEPPRGELCFSIEHLVGRGARRVFGNRGLQRGRQAGHRCFKLRLNTIAVFLNQGGGTFAAPIINTILIPNGLGPALGDFNEDGKPDLIAATVAGPQIDLVLLGHSDGTFAQSAAIPNSFGFLHGRLADLNGDKHLDFVGCSNATFTLLWATANALSSRLCTCQTGRPQNTYFGCDVGDFNADKTLDILGANFSSDTSNLVFFAGNGDGTFQALTVLSSGSSNPDSISAADFNGDGRVDVLVGFNAGNASLFLGNGVGGLGEPVGVYCLRTASAAPSRRGWR